MVLQITKKKIATYLIYLFPLAYVIGPFAADLSISVIGLLYIFCNYNKLSSLKLEKYQIFLFCFWIFTIFSSIINYQYGVESLGRSIAFIRFIILIIAIKYFIDNDDKLKKYVLFTITILILVGIDILFQSLTTFNFIGLKLEHLNPVNKDIYLRPSGFFREELIAGSYFLYMTVPLLFSTYYLYNRNIIIPKVLIYSLLLIPLFIILAGERMMILYLLGIIFLTFIFSNKFEIINKNIPNFKYAKIFLLITLIAFIYFYAPLLLNRFEFIFDMSLQNCRPDYLCLFKSAYEIFKENLFFGIGLKNFRNICPILGGVCSTHPHNLYLEILSETGILGISLFLIFLFNFILKIKNLYKFGFEYFFLALIIVFVIFWPISASRSLFSNYAGCLIWFNVSILVASKSLALRNLEK